MKRVMLKSKDLNKLLEEYHFEAKKKDIVECVENKVILINKIPSFFYYEKKLIPTVRMLAQKSLLKEIIVDMGAVKFVIGGADIMRPGIIEMDSEIKEGEAVVILDANNKKPLAVGIALFDGKTMQSMSSGKVIKNIHQVGDEIWKTI
ncbi:DUF1947 domain-containing protein [Candidatus Woesearchaeota archaeon]|nr:DUF1947 domain-containing protein [Candidatus Woesearchaeota archaeon]